MRFLQRQQWQQRRNTTAAAGAASSQMEINALERKKRKKKKVGRQPMVLLIAGSRLKSQVVISSRSRGSCHRTKFQFIRSQVQQSMNRQIEYEMPTIII